MWPRFMTNVLLIVFVIIAVIFLLIRLLEKTSVFFPGRTIEHTPQRFGLSYEDLYLTTADGVKINAWLVKSDDARATVIFAHGNAGTMGDRVMKLKFFHDLGLNVLIFDYRGYGNSQGVPSERGVYLDAQAVYDHIKSRGDIGKAPLIGYGASLGGAVIIDLATKRVLDMLMIESSFTSAAQMARRLYPALPTFMMSVKLDSIAKIGAIKGPKLFLHSLQDRTVPFSMGQALYEEASDPKAFIVLEGGHNDGSLMLDPQVRLNIQHFLKEHL